MLLAQPGLFTTCFGLEESSAKAQDSSATGEETSDHAKTSNRAPPYMG